MTRTLFFKLGQQIYRHRILVLVFWILLILALSPFMPHIMIPFHATGFSDETSESVLTQQFLDKKLGYKNDNQFILLYHSPHLKNQDPKYLQTIKQSLRPLKHFSIAHEIIYPNALSKQLSKDKHSASVVILFKTQKTLTTEDIKDFKAHIKTPKNMHIKIGGESIFLDQINAQTQKDLFKADFIAAPVSITVLIFVFGSIVAALIPLCLGGGCALIILTMLFFLGHLFNLSIFTLNIALLLGLCLSLDYALFIISRFRSERKTNPIEQAIAITLSTAGRAVFFSGLAIFISLSALLLFPINILFSMGVGGLVAVFIAVSIALLLLPAVLSVLNQSIDWLSVRQLNGQNKLWHHIANLVVKHPIFFFSTTLILLILLGIPFIHAKYGLSDYHILPKHAESRAFFNAYSQAFDENTLNQIQAVIFSQKRPILSHRSFSSLYDFVHQLKKNKSIKSIESIIPLKTHFTETQLEKLYHTPQFLQQEDIRQLLKTTTKKHFTVVTIISKHPENSPATKALIQTLKTTSLKHGLTLKLTGTPVINDDVLTRIGQVFPYAIAWTMVLSYIILLFLLRSLILPLKAILMSIISLSASYGILVFVFQEGHLHEWLNFDPQGMLDISLLIIIFCALFGFSMDYEVFLLSRIHEAYRKILDNKKSIIFGVEQSGRIITSAAVIVICICGSFMFADVIMVKAFGLGIAVAVFVDAFIIRTMLVPSTMMLLKNWCWYLPRWLDRLLP